MEFQKDAFEDDNDLSRLEEEEEVGGSQKAEENGEEAQEALDSLTAGGGPGFNPGPLCFQSGTRSREAGVSSRSRRLPKGEETASSEAGTCRWECLSLA